MHLVPEAEFVAARRKQSDHSLTHVKRCHEVRFSFCACEGFFNLEVWSHQMKKVAIRTLVLAVGLSLSAAPYAQTRHDEKPHGTPKKAVKKSDVQQPRGSGTRHDEKPHGQPKAKAEAEKK
jgi:hypothetical protein